MKAAVCSRICDDGVAEAMAEVVVVVVFMVVEVVESGVD